jgi:hypothetical protein
MAEASIAVRAEIAGDSRRWQFGKRVGVELALQFADEVSLRQTGRAKARLIWLTLNGTTKVVPFRRACSRPLSGDSKRGGNSVEKGKRGACLFLLIYWLGPEEDGCAAEPGLSCGSSI